MKARVLKVAHVDSASKLWAMKQSAQARDRKLAAKSDISGGEMLLIRPEQVRGAKIAWPLI